MLQAFADFLDVGCGDKQQNRCLRESRLGQASVPSLELARQRQPRVRIRWGLVSQMPKADAARAVYAHDLAGDRRQHNQRAAQLLLVHARESLQLRQGDRSTADPSSFVSESAARRIRSDPQIAEMRLIALTGYGQAADREQALAAGFDEHLVKPVAPDRVARLLAGASATDDE